MIKGAAANRRTGAEALLLAVFFSLALCSLVHPARLDNTGFSFEYMQMSRDPFAATGDLRRRFLLPLIGFCFGLTGDRLVFVVLFLLFLTFLGLSLYLVKSLALQFSSAFFILANLCFLPLFEFSLAAGSWPDVGIYCCFAWALVFIEQGVLFAAVGCLFHESLIFLLPGILLLGSLRTSTLSSSQYALWFLRLLLVSCASIMSRDLFFSSKGPAYSPDSYLSVLKENILNGPWRQPYLLGIVITLKSGALFIPLGLLQKTVRGLLKKEIVLCVACVGSFIVALYVAKDFSRVISLLFPLHFFALIQLRSRESLLASGALINLIIPSYFISFEWFASLRSTLGYLDVLVHALWKDWHRTN
jgi:hypothetical protein